MITVLRDDTLGAEFAGMGEDGPAVAFQVLAVLDARRGVGKECAKSGFALLKGPRPPVRAVQLQQVEGVEEHLIVIGAAMQPVEDRQARLIAVHRFPADCSGRRR